MIYLVKNEISNLKNKEFILQKKSDHNDDNTKIQFFYYSLGFAIPFVLFKFIIYKKIFNPN